MLGVVAAVAGGATHADATGDDTADDLTTMRPPGCCNSLGPRPHPVQRLPQCPPDPWSPDSHLLRFYNRVKTRSAITCLIFTTVSVCIFTVYRVSLLARLGLKLFWLILMAVLDSTLKYFVLSLFVCLRLSGHTQLPPVLARPPPSRLFLTPSAISVKTEHSFAKLASTK